MRPITVRDNSVRKLTRKRGATSRSVPLGRKLLLRGILLLLLSLPLVLGSRRILSSRLFYFRSVEIDGCERVKKDEIYQLLKEKINRQSLFKIDLSDYQKKIEEQPWVKQVRLRRILPQKIHVGITEHQVYALLSLRKLYYLNDQGYTIAEVSLPDKLDYPILSGLDGIPADKQREQVLKAYSLFKILDGIYPKQEIAEVHRTAKDEFSVLVGEPSIQINFGRSGWDIKVDRLKKVLDDVYRKHLQISRIDLDFEKKVVVKLRK